MALEPITRQEKIIAGQDLTPITRMEMFLKEYGGSGGSGGGGGGGAVTTLHINVTAANMETMEATFTADNTPAEMQQASANGPIWCVVSFAEGVMDEVAVTVGVPPVWGSGAMAFGMVIWLVHDTDGSNKISYFVSQGPEDTWIIDLNAFGS